MSDQLIELGLLDRASSGQEPLSDSSGPELVSLLDRFLSLIADSVVESDTLDTNEFRVKLAYYRRSLNQSSPDAIRAMDSCLSLCQDYLNRARVYLFERESEFAQVIELMRVALSKLAGDASAFNVNVMNTSERIHGLTEIVDIRELKKQISHEVRTLNRLVEEKQKQDDLNYSKLSRRIEILQANLTRSKEEASIDPLTRVANRRSFDQALERWVKAHRENRQTFVLAMVDIDDFKKINDTHGHQVGDRVLYCAAEWLSQSVRNTDFLGRYGGEEFVIMLADVQAAQAEQRFTDLLSKICNSTYSYKLGGEERAVQFSVSCGLAEFVMDESGEDLLRRADEALYSAKRTGKNKVVIAKTQKSLWKSLTVPGLPRKSKQ
jgi:diguanylate cyclase